MSSPLSKCVKSISVVTMTLAKNPKFDTVNSRYIEVEGTLLITSI